MFHLAMYSGSIAQDADVNLPAITDQVLTIQDNGFLLQHDMDLVWASMIGVTAVHAFINSPSNDVVTTPYIRPVNLGAVMPSFGQVADYRAHPFRLKGLESITVTAQQTAVGAEVEHVPVGFQDQFVPAPQGNVYTMRGASTTAGVADTWTDLTVTWANNLPAGRYAVVGLSVVGAAAIAARLILNDQVLRPGCIVGDVDGNNTPALFRKGGLGKWGEFRSTDMPRLEVFGTGVTAVWTVYLDFVRLTAGGLS